LLADREVALRLATNRDVDRKPRIAAGSRFFWVYSLSLWDPDAFWKCISGASAFALVGLYLAGLMPGGFIPARLTATVIFEYFLLGLILMWAYNLGPWLHPTNLIVIFTLIFRLYRNNLTMDDLSAQEIGRLFPEDDPELDTGGKAILSRLYLRIRRSSVLGSLILGLVLAALMVALLLLAS
jgi:hypothetical protein